MIVKKFYKEREDGTELYVTYSDKNVMIQKVGTEEVYEAAVDVEGTAYEYTETDIVIEKEDEEAETDAAAEDVE